MPRKLDRDALLDALERIGSIAAEHGASLEIAVYGGSALMLATNFRFGSEDVDIAALDPPWPDWLREIVERLAVEKGWSRDWLNEAVSFHLSSLATADDHIAFGTFPRNSCASGLRVFVPTAEYMLALKLKASRINDPAKGEQEVADILNLAKAIGIAAPEEALEILAKFFPKSGLNSEKQRFLLKHIWNRDTHDAPSYLGRSR